MIDSEYTLAFISEFLFVIFIGTTAYTFVIKKRLSEMHRRLSQKNDIINNLRNNKARGPTKDNVNTNEAEKKLADCLSSLRAERLRVDSLKKFKHLYFRLDACSNKNNNEELTKELQSSSDENEKIIEELKVRIEMITKAGQASSDYADELESSIEKLEATNKKTKNKVEELKGEDKKQRETEFELHEIKKQAKYLTKKEELHNIETINQKRKLQKLKNELSETKINSEEQARLAKELSEKDDEISRLRAECDTLGSQYHELAMQSMSAPDETSPDDMKQEIEELKESLTKASYELYNKKVQCDSLEAEIMHMDNSESKEALNKLTKERSKQAALETNYSRLSDRVESFADDETKNKMRSIKAMREGKQEAISGINDSFQESQKNQAVDTDPQWQDKYKTLTKKYNTLIKRVKRDEAAHKELNELKSEYAELENRYASLAYKDMSS